jgi:2-furoyl-CoA dehydrogenase large subunit
VTPPDAPGARRIRGEGTTIVAAPPEAVWRTLLDPATLAVTLPGCRRLEPVGPHAYQADLVVRIGPVRARYAARVALSDLDPPRALRLAGEAAGALGTTRGEGVIRFDPVVAGGGAPAATTVRYRYAIEVGGTVAAVGGRMLDGATRAVIGEFFERLAAQVANPRPEPGGAWTRLRRLLRGPR